MIEYLKRHHWGMLATFLAVGGTAYAATQLPPNSVGTKQIRNHAVTIVKISPQAQTALKEPKGRAGGALAGAYPNPRLAAPGPELAATYSTGRVLGSRWGWQSFGHGFARASYYRDITGVVHLAGVVQSFAGGSDPNLSPNQCGRLSIFVLPAGDRPAQSHDFLVDSGSAYGRVTIGPDGQVTCASGAGDQYVALDGITFRAGG